MSRAATNFRLVGLLIAFSVAAAGWGLTCAAWHFDRVAAGAVPLDPRSFERLTLVVLGSAGAHPDPNRRGPALALAAENEVVLVDAGRGVAEALRAAKIPASQPGAVVLTSLVPENVVGLDDLLAAARLEGRREPIALYGPPGSAALARDLEAALWAGAPRDAAVFAPVEVEDGFTLERGSISLRAGALPGGPAPALSWRFAWRGREAVVSSAGWAPDALVLQARGAHLWAHEAVMLPTPEQARELGLETDIEALRREAELHTSVDALGALARRAGSETLVLVRLRPPPVFDLQFSARIDSGFEGRVVVAEDGDELTP